MSDTVIQNAQDNIFVPVYDTPKVRTANSGAGLYFEQSYINCYPELYKNLSQYAAPGIAAIKRAGTLANAALTPTIASYGTSTNMVCLANEVVTQLYDVYVTAFFDSNTNKIYIIQYRPIALTTTKIGEITGANINDLVFITEIVDANGVTSAQLAAGSFLTPAIAISYQKADKSSGTGYYAMTTAGVFTTSSLTTISSGSFPSNLANPRIITGPFQQLNGQTCIMTIDGFIYQSQLTGLGFNLPDITSWNVNAVVTASQYPDRGVGVYRYKHILIAVGQDSIEFWSADNNAPPQSSLVRTDQAFIKFGAAGPKLIKNIDDIIYWVAYGSTDTIGVWRLDGYAPSKISTQREDAILMNFSNASGYPSYFTLDACLINSKKHLILNGWISYTLLFAAQATSFPNTDTFQTVPTSDGTAAIQCYNIQDQMWWAMNQTGTANCFIMATTAFPSAQVAGQYNQYFFRRTSGPTGNNGVSSTLPFSWRVNGTEGQWYDDNPSASPTTQPITVSINFNTIWNGTTRRKFLRRLSAIMDTLTVDVVGADTNVYSMYFLWDKTGFHPQTAFLNLNVRGIVVPLSKVTSRYNINNLGNYRQLNLCIVLKSKDYFRMQGLEIETSQGTS